MADIVLNNVSDILITELGKRAADHHRSPTEEAKSILSAVLLQPRNGDWSQVDAIFDRLTASGRHFDDSAALIREDRDR
jgi:plasmid stability protein